MSFLRSEGHHEAHLYPVWKLWHEAKIARRRVNGQYRTQAVIAQIAAAAGFSGGKKVQAHFKKFLEQFDVEDD